MVPLNFIIRSYIIQYYATTIFLIQVEPSSSTSRIIRRPIIVLHGELTALKYCRENGCPWDEERRSAAAESGHLNILKWRRANGMKKRVLLPEKISSMRF